MFHLEATLGVNCNEVFDRFGQLCFFPFLNGFNSCELNMLAYCCDERNFIDKHNVNAESDFLLFSRIFLGMTKKLITTVFGFVLVVYPFKA